MHRPILAALTLTLLSLANCLSAAAQEPQFAEQIAPILLAKCVACHNGKKAEGGYRVDSYTQLLKEGDSGTAPVAAGNLDDSELFRRITSSDEDERMPLDAEPLPAEQIEAIRQWIAAGAKFNDSLAGRSLASIVPAPTYPPAPEAYAQPLPVTALAFSADGEQLFVGGYHEITVWNTADGTLVKRLGNVGQRVYAIARHPTAQQMAVACGQPGRYGEVRIIDPETGDMLQSLAGSDDVVFDARYDPAGERLAVASADASLRIYRTSDGELLQTITSHSDWVTAAAWSANGDRIATASRDKTAKVFDPADGRSLITYSDHEAEVRGVAFHSDNSRVYSAAANNKLHRWKIEDGKRDKETGLGGPAFGLTQVGDFLLVAAGDKKLYRIALDSGDIQRSYEGHADWVLSAAGHADTGRVAAGGFDGRVIVWNAESGERISAFVAAPGYASNAAGD